MAKRSKNSDRQPAAHKMMKKNVDDDERLSSPYTTAELWKKLQYYVLREIFAYMDIRVSNMCCRVNMSWRSQLVKTQRFNQSIAFLDWRVGCEAEWQMIDAFELPVTSPWPWRSLLQLDLSGIKHLVNIGKTITISTHCKMAKVAFADKQSLETITFWGGYFVGRSRMLRLAARLWDEDILLQLRQCDIQWGRQFSFTDPRPDCAYRNERCPPNLVLSRATWSITVSVQHLVFDGKFQRIGGRRKRLRWLHRHFNRLNVMWPYGEDQVEWLKTSVRALSSLEENVMQDIESCTDQFCQWTWSLRNYNFKTLKVLDANGDELLLSTLDCAFLGRLISNLPEGKRPEGWKPPPQPFLGNFVCKWRKVDGASLELEKNQTTQNQNQTKKGQLKRLLVTLVRYLLLCDCATV